jgi:hypothetical protein
MDLQNNLSFPQLLKPAFCISGASIRRDHRRVSISFVDPGLAQVSETKT